MNNPSSPFRLANIRLFITFRILFNCRFYYPIFTILFLDYGLSIEQFALLNTVWAITIVCAEVPSGALADLLGRRRLLITTALCMVAEMAIIAFVPLTNIDLVFWAFLVNRVLSGLAEAMASGADEAIAYDSLQEQGLAAAWPKVLSLQMRLKSIGSIVAAITGAMLYDPDLSNRLIGWLGLSGSLTQQDTMRFPVYLTLLLALLATGTAVMFRETAPDGEQPPAGDASPFHRMTEAMRLTWQTGRWILATPFALAVILFGMFFDHILRMLITLASQYFRLIHLPEASFGLLSAALSLLGLFVPKLCETMVERNSARRNMFLLLAVTLSGLAIMRGFYPYIGVVAIGFVYVGLTMVSFFTSHYLNRITSSASRATVLSFKGMAFNLGYGLIGIFFALLIQHLRSQTAVRLPGLGESALEQQSFMLAIAWFPWYTMILFIFMAGSCAILLRHDATDRQGP